MDFHLDRLLNLPNITVFSCQEKEGCIILKLNFLTEGISCPHCQNYTDELHQNRPILIRDLAISGKIVYLHVPRRQFYCPQCQKYPTEPLKFVENRRSYTIRYEEYIYERVKELTVQQVSNNEQLTGEKVQNIFSRIAKKKKTGQCQKD